MPLAALRKRVWIPTLTLLLGLGGGFVLGIYAEGRRAAREGDDWVDRIELSHAALETTLSTQYLKMSRQGNEERLLHLLETRLDSSLAEIGRTYTPDRDSAGAAAIALVHAREYRAAYPHQAAVRWLAPQINAALALKTPPPPYTWKSSTDGDSAKPAAENGEE